MTDHAPPSPDTRPGPPSWPYSNAMAKANNIIWRLCKGVSPQQIYDALDAEGLAIIDKTGGAQRQGLPSAETMLNYASILEKPKFDIRNGIKYPLPNGEATEAAIKALRFCAALAPGHAGAGEAWQPIETAPHDKTMVALLFTDGKRTRYGVGWYMPIAGWQGWYRGNDHVAPTHWMPLPAAPLPKTQGD